MKKYYFEINDNKIVWWLPKVDNWKYELKEKSETRSQAQNRLYHKWITDLVSVFDNKGIFITHDDLHEWLRDKLIKWTYEINPITKRRLVVRKSTAELKKEEFSQYLKDVENYLWQTFEVSHPLPTDIWYNFN